MAERLPREVPVGDLVHAWALRVGAASMVSYFVDFFTSGRVRTAEDKAYVDFERSFVLADSYVLVSGLLAAHLMVRGRKEAVPVGVAAGSGLVFLGLMDLAYDVQQRKFSERTPEMAVEKEIVATCLTLGPLTMVRLWMNRSRFTG